MNFGTILIVITLVVSLIACVAKTKRDNAAFPRNITLAGWSLALLAIITGGINYWRSQQMAFADKVQESLALRRIEAGIYRLMVPSTVISDLPEMSSRFRVVNEYGGAGAISGLCDVKLAETAKQVRVAPEYNNAKWGELITDTTNQGLDELRQAQSAYGRFLNDNINSLIGEVLAHPWNEFLLSSKGRIIRRPDFAQPMCLEKPESARKRYVELADDYWKTLAKLESSAGHRYCSLRKTLKITDTPPLFLRYVSGLFFIPDKAQSDEAMKTACARLTA